MVEKEGRQYRHGILKRALGSVFPIAEPKVSVSESSKRIGLVTREHVAGGIQQEQKGTVVEIETDVRQLAEMLKASGVSRWQRKRTQIVFKEGEDIPDASTDVSVTHQVRSWRHPFTRNKIEVTIPSADITTFSDLQKRGNDEVVNQYAESLTRDIYGKLETNLLRYGHRKYHQRIAHSVRSIVAGYPMAVAGRFAFDNVIGKDIPEVNLSNFIKHSTGIDIFNINPHLTDFLHLLQQISFLARDSRTLAISGIVTGLLFLGRNILHRKLYNRKKEKFLAAYHYDDNALPIGQVDTV